MKIYQQVLLALLPLGLTPLIFQFIVYGYIDFGAGEKDMAMIVPWIVWSLFFSITGLVLIYRRWWPQKWLVAALSVATVGLLMIGVLAHLTGILGLS